MLIVPSPKSPDDMDWASLYHAYAVKKLAEEEDKNAITVDESRASDEAGLQDQREARATVQDVEIADRRADVRALNV